MDYSIIIICIAMIDIARIPCIIAFYTFMLDLNRIIEEMALCR